MKAILSSSGYFSLSLMILGSLFKVQHYPGASVMLIVGTFIFVMAFLPMYFAYRLKNKGSQMEVFEALAFIISMGLISLGILFKVQHYPGGSFLYIMGLCLFTAIFIPLYVLRFFQEKRQRQSQNILIGLIMIAFTTMFMAHNISRGTLMSYIVNEEKVALNNNALRNSNQVLFTALTQSKPEEQVKRLESIHAISSEMNQLLEDYKTFLLQEIEGNWGAENSYTNGKEISLRNSTRKDAIDAPSAILIGFPESPNEGEWSAINLKLELVQHREKLMELTQSEELKTELGILLAYDGVMQFGYKEPWEIAFFYHMPLVSVIHTLSVLQNATLTAEAMVLGEST